MRDVYVEIVLNAPADPSVRELISFQLHEWGFSGFLEDDASIHCFLPKSRWNKTTQERLAAFIADKRPGGVSISSITEILNENWNRRWEESILPVEAGNTFIIIPSWHPVPAKPGKIAITIDPKMSFGTGYHESTRLMLRMIEEHGALQLRVLDVGTGTGVLAVAAAKLGSKHVLGIDVDEWSYLNARENVDRNACGDLIEIRLGSLEVVTETGFDMILANITRNVILELLPLLLQKLKKGGFLICSGFILEDKTIMEDSLRHYRCAVLSTVKENEWIGMAAQKT